MDYPQEHIKPYNTEGDKGKQVEQMFDHIASAYDLLNHTLSFGIDKYWRRKAIRTLKPYHPQEMMDVATGTGDFALLAYDMLRPERLVGTDISEKMMDIARAKVEKAGLTAHITFEREDCTALSYADDQKDAITVAFGIRNFASLEKGLGELYRVLKPQGHLVILELTTPEHFPMRQLFALYSRLIIPTLGKLLSKDNIAYRYLPMTIKAFPQGEIMKAALLKAGFSKASFKRLTFGICTLYEAEK